MVSITNESNNSGYKLRVAAGELPLTEAEVFELISQSVKAVYGNEVRLWIMEPNDLKNFAKATNFLNGMLKSGT